MIAFWGIGNYLEKNIGWLQKKLNVKYLCDNDSSKWGCTFYGIECISPEELRKHSCEVLITVENPGTYFEIKRQLQEWGIPVADMQLKTGSMQQINKKKLFIWGSFNECRALHVLMDRSQSDYEVEGYISCWAEQLGTDPVTNYPVVSLFKAENMLLKNQIDGIIAIADEFPFGFVTQRTVREEVLEKDTFYISEKGAVARFWEEPEYFDMRQIIIPYKYSYRVTNLQFLVTKKCNLNCRFCSHFMGLADEKEAYSYEEFAKDIERTTELFDDIDYLDIWGGEALLCNNLEKYLYKAHKAFPKAQIQIGTNGLLVKNMKEELIQAIQDTKTQLTISMYPPTTNIIDETVAFLKRNEIPFVRELNKARITNFLKLYNLKGETDIRLAYKICQEEYGVCSTIYKGKISPCYVPIVSSPFNKKYGECFSVEEDVFDLYSPELTKENCISKFRKPLSACRYCAPWNNRASWETIGDNPQITDWVEG